MNEIIEEIYRMCGVTSIEGDWNKLMDVVHFIENIDHKDRYYQWDEYEEDDLTKPKITHYNFNGYSVDIEGNHCWIDLNLSLDPSVTICSISSKTKFLAVLEACYEFAKYYNEKK